MLTAQQISKYYGNKLVLDKISFCINRRDRFGLIGPNGCGKTTLLRILAGEEQADFGTVVYQPDNIQLGYIPQGYEFPQDLSFCEILRNISGNIEECERELSFLSQELAQSPDRQDLQLAYDRTLQRLINARIQDEGRMPSLLKRFGLDHISDNFPVNALSGGQKTRLALLRVLFYGADFLLLDEPTNHLDMSMIEWLEEWLRAFQGGVLVVSHDREFLERSVNHIIAMDPVKHTIKIYAGSYSFYREQYQAEREKKHAMYQDQVAKINTMQKDILHMKNKALKVERSTTPRQPFVRGIAKRVARKAKSREKKLERFLASEDIIEKPQQSWKMKLDLSELPPTGKDVLLLEHLDVGYCVDAPLLKDLNLKVHVGQRIILTGLNGSGKTTLLRTIARQIDPLSGGIRYGSGVKTGLMAQEQRDIDPSLSALEIVQNVTGRNETSVRSFLHLFLFAGDDALRPARDLSYGERARLNLALLIAEGCNFLLMDEPTNHLDIPSREQFEEAIRVYEGTLLIVSHDRYFIDRIATQRWHIENHSIR